MYARTTYEDIRTGERRPFQGAVQVSWQTRSGEMKTIRAKCLDLSDQGARIECDSPIDLRTNVYLQAPGFWPDGQCHGALLQAERDETHYWITVQLGSQPSGSGQKAPDPDRAERGETTSSCMLTEAFVL